ncbi:amidohydrolase family protein [Rhodohalobacter halophilus]|uniref:amidohydrolase family protein n=1 Tax=Rhodohalobacter halophilus TaxID=1812810 RepID=UPI00083F5C90|nr:amidohydrolase family protein [Rhodohalobacter halophilus]
MDRYNIVLAVVSGPEIAIRTWQENAPGRFIGGVFLGDEGLPEHSPNQLTGLVEDGVMGAFGELGLQYYGIEPDDPRMHEYYETAERLGIPVALHTGLGPPRGPHTFAPEFRTTLGRPSLFEPVLVRHPNLKAYLMHAGWPYISETIALMYVYPDLYADVGVLSWALPREAFHEALRSLINAGFGDRLLFGTDQMFWPGAIGLAIETLENVPFLSDEQKRDIFYNNAARFLQLSEEEIARHHGK